MLKTKYKINDKKENKNKDDNILKESIFIYKDSNENKILYSFQQISKDGNYYELRCKDRNCSGRAKYIIESEEIKQTKECSISKFEDHNYIKEKYIKEKIKKNKLL